MKSSNNKVFGSVRFLLVLGGLFWGIQALARADQDALVLAKAKDVFEFAYDNTYQALVPCRALPTECGLTKREQTMIHLIYMENLRSRRTTETLVFKSGRENPGLFQIDGATRIAFTEYRAKAPITINTDLIVQMDASKRLQALSLEQAVAVIAHELGHHLPRSQYLNPLPSHEELDALAGKVRLYMERHKTSQKWLTKDWRAITADNFVEAIDYTFLSTPGQSQETTLFLLASRYNLITPLREISTKTRCPKSYYRGELNFEGDPFDLYMESPVFKLSGVKQDQAVLNMTFQKGMVRCVNRLAGYENQMGVFDRYRNGKITLPLRMKNGMLEPNVPEADFDVTVPPDHQYH